MGQCKTRISGTLTIKMNITMLITIVMVVMMVVVVITLCPCSALCEGMYHDLLMLKLLKLVKWLA